MPLGQRSCTLFRERSLSTQNDCMSCNGRPHRQIAQADLRPSVRPRHPQSHLQRSTVSTRPHFNIFERHESTCVLHAVGKHQGLFSSPAPRIQLQGYQSCRAASKLDRAQLLLFGLRWRAETNDCRRPIKEIGLVRHSLSVLDFSTTPEMLARLGTIIHVTRGLPFLLLPLSITLLSISKSLFLLRYYTVVIFITFA